MPKVSFSDLPDSARVWVFASDRRLAPEESSLLLREVDAFLDQWKAHGAPLRNAREWRDEQFLVIGVDPTFEQASGCSIDGLFRSLQQLGATLGTSLVSGGRVFYRDEAGSPRLVARPRIKAVIGPDTSVFDTSLTSAGDYRTRFELPARESWVSSFIQQTTA
jgi:hypothetical protein